MRAIICRAFGGFAALDVAQREVPTVGPGRIRIAVQAAGVNPNDVLAIEGGHHNRPDPPFVPGGEVSGVVAELGEGVDQFVVGERVIAMTPSGFGGLAEEAIVPVWSAISVPSSIDPMTAAGLLSSYFTAYNAVRIAGRGDAGDTALVLGATGGVGFAAVEIASALGCRVLATAGSAEKAAAIRRADAVIDLSRERLKDAVMRLTDGRGVDLVVDPVGGEAFRETCSCTAYEGRVAVVGFASGAIPQLRTIHLLLRGISLIGCNLGLCAEFSPERFRRAGEQLYRWHEAGLICPPSPAVYSPDEAVAAFARVTDRSRPGKVVIKFDRE